MTPSDPSTDYRDEAQRLRSLVSRLAAGQRDALKPLYEATVSVVRATAMSVLRDAALAEDAIAETYVQVWRGVHRYDPARSSVPAWIAMIARSRAIDVKRAQRTRYERALTHDPSVVAGASASQVADTASERSETETVLRAASDAESTAQIRAAIEELSPEQRESVQCAFLEGLTHVEVAERLGLPLGTVKTRIRAGLAQLRQRLGALSRDFDAAAAEGEVIS